MKLNAMLISGLMTFGMTYGQTIPVPKVDVPPVKMDVIEVQLTERDLLEYYKAQREVDVLTNTQVIHVAQAKRDAVVGKLQAKCGDRGIVGNGTDVEFKCGVTKPKEEPKPEVKDSKDSKNSGK